jgi:hypothetical protein
MVTWKRIVYDAIRRHILTNSEASGACRARERKAQERFPEATNFFKRPSESPKVVSRSLPASDLSVE